MRPSEWDDDRIADAYRALTSESAPKDVRAMWVRRGTRLPAPLAAAAVIVVLLMGATLALSTRSGPLTSPPASPTGSRGVDLPILSVGELLGGRVTQLDDAERLVRGWLHPSIALSCPAPAPGTPEVDGGPLDAFCGSLTWLSDQPATAEQQPLQPSEPRIDLFTDVDVSIETPLPRVAPAQVIVFGHFNDRRASFCSAEAIDRCRHEFVVDRIVAPTADAVLRPPAGWQAMPGPIRHAGAAGTHVVAALGAPLTVVSEGVIDGTELEKIEPGIRTHPELAGRGGVWVVRGYDPADPGRTLRSFMVRDEWVGTMPPVAWEFARGGMVQRGGASADASPPTVLGLPVRSVADLVALQGGSFDDREIAVRGWLSPFVAVPCPSFAISPLEIGCPEEFQWLMAAPEELSVRNPDGSGSFNFPSGPGVNPKLDMASDDPSAVRQEAVEVIAVGHLDDPRASRCPVELRQRCRQRFVVDRIALPTDPPVAGLPQPWATAEDSHATLSSVVEHLARIEQRATVLSAGSIDGRMMRFYEPTLAAVPDLAEAGPVWLVRIMDPGGSGRSRLFAIREPWLAKEPKIAYELTREGPVRREAPGGPATSSP